MKKKQFDDFLEAMKKRELKGEELINTLREKNKPKKPINPRKINKRLMFWECPYCSNAVLKEFANSRDRHSYCWNCGQKLDWSKDEK